MIEGNYNNKTVYAHRSIIANRLLRAGWPAFIAGDEIPVEILASKENCGYWYYTGWAVLASGQRVMMDLPGWHLFRDADAAILDVIQQQKHALMLRYSRCYHHKKKGMFARLKDFLAKKHQAGASTSSRMCDERNKQGGSQPFPALPITSRRVL